MSENTNEESVEETTEEAAEPKEKKPRKKSFPDMRAMTKRNVNGVVSFTPVGPAFTRLTDAKAWIKANAGRFGAKDAPVEFVVGKISDVFIAETEVKAKTTLSRLA